MTDTVVSTRESPLVEASAARRRPRRPVTGRGTSARRVASQQGPRQLEMRQSSPLGMLVKRQGSAELLGLSRRQRPPAVASL